MNSSWQIDFCIFTNNRLNQRRFYNIGKAGGANLRSGGRAKPSLKGKGLFFWF